KLNRPGGRGGVSDGESMEKEVKSFNQMRKAAAGQGAVVAEIDEAAYVAYKNAFWQYQRKGNIDWLTQEERKAMSVGTDSDGGYLTPAPTAGRIVQKVFELSPIRQIANVMSISTDALEGVNDLDEASYGWVSEVGARNDTNTPTVGKYRIEAHEMYAQPKATQKLLDDAAVDIEAWLAKKVSDRFARAEAAAFVTGNGVGQPRGFASYTTAATGDATRAWGQIEHVVTGANGAFHTTQADPLFDLIGAFKTPYLQNARWVTRREVIAAIRKFKTTTTLEYIWQPGLQAGQPDRLLGYPIVIAQDMPALATGSLSMALGDFNEAYQIVDRIGMRTLRDPFTDKPYVKFYTTKRTGGAVVNFEAVKFIKFSS
ncbi:MAG TPA: phage major capsid protein, partial [Gammaproteobacteria bacterium]|nr:phage major capsid protein [Gammaproteobacteria bacterium]MCH76860.1 phage major capsid protein [Gammaproteobacteria bacterium]